MKRLGHIALFMVTLFALYVATVGAATFVKVGGLSIIERLINAPLKLGQNPHTLVQFREVDQYQGADVVLLGSSQVVHGFDVRVFHEAGVTAFNIGTPAQAPLGSYYVLKRYWDVLEPSCLVVFEIFPRELAKDTNMETLADMATNTPPSWHIVQMAFAEKKFAALNMLLSAYWSQLRRPLSQIEPRLSEEEEEYISGGYVPLPDTVASIDTAFYRPRYDLVERQVDHVRRAIRFVKKKGRSIVLVTHPLPEELRQTVEKYDEAVDYVHSLAEEEGVPYLDFNEILSFETHTHFSDENHLNAAAARIFTQALLQELKGLGFSCLQDARPEQVVQMPEEGTTAPSSPQ